MSSVSAFAADRGYKVIYEGGSVEGLIAGNKAEIDIASNEIRLVRDGKESLSIPASAVTEISYGQDFHRRVGAAIGLAVASLGVSALMALSKSKKHLVGLTWASPDAKGGLQCSAIRTTTVAYWRASKV